MTKEEKINKDRWVIIKDGVLESGRIDKAAVGAEDGKVIRKLETLVNSEALKDFIDNAGKLGSAFLMRRGFTLGISDLDINTKSQTKITEEIEKSRTDAMNLIKKFEKGETRVLPGMTANESLETQIMSTLANGVSRVSEIVKENVVGNDIFVMAKSGAKGSIINITQMAAVVGQETIVGKRIERGYFGRTLSHFPQEDLSPLSHGFVSKGFKQGLSPFELFWNIMNGREGLMDKSLRTRKSGYMQRRLVNALQDLKVSEDLTIKNSVNEIVQFRAGEDGIDPSKSYWGGINIKDAENYSKETKKGAKV